MAAADDERIWMEEWMEGLLHGRAAADDNEAKSGLRAAGSIVRTGDFCPEYPSGKGKKLISVRTSVSASIMGRLRAGGSHTTTTTTTTNDDNNTKITAAPVVTITITITI